MDSRIAKDQSAIRRRRECLSCNKRFTTFERVEINLPLVIKRDQSRAPYDRYKVENGVRKACEKRPVSLEQIEELVNDLEQVLRENGEKEVPVAFIGEHIMANLKELDDVAYIRFASVYRQFKDINEFMQELQGLLKQSPGEPS
ncbi:MAG: transcriptional regulator NrdR [Pseudomonadota bacterium]|nr:transcriptional regulator NrdR [Pseudomonadota bacterium]